MNSNSAERRSSSSAVRKGSSPGLLTPPARAPFNPSDRVRPRADRSLLPLRSRANASPLPPPWRCLCRCGRRASCAAASRCAMVLLLLRPEDRFGSAEIAPTRAISARQIDDRFINWARAAYPRAAAHTRMVSVARIRPDSRKSVRPFKGMICDDISEFESNHPSHAVGLPQVRSPMGNLRAQGRAFIPERATSRVHHSIEALRSTRPTCVPP